MKNKKLGINLDDFLQEYYTKHPNEINNFKMAVLAEYNNDKNMSAKELLAIFRHIAEIEGYTKFARKAKLAREHLYRAISVNANPTLSTLEKLANSCGLRISFIPR